MKLDVWFDEGGNASLMFWNTSEQSFKGRVVLTQELQKIGWENKFDDEIGYGYNGYTKRFKIGNAYKTITMIDKDLYDFTRQFLDALHNKQSIN